MKKQEETEKKLEEKTYKTGRNWTILNEKEETGRNRKKQEKRKKLELTGRNRKKKEEIGRKRKKQEETGRNRKKQEETKKKQEETGRNVQHGAKICGMVLKMPTMV